MVSGSEVENLVDFNISIFWYMLNKLLHLVFETCLLASGYVYSL